MESLANYKSVFDAVESTLIATAVQNGVADIRQQLDWFKTAGERTFTDTDFYREIVEITFYSGFKAETVDARLSAIHRWFPNFQTVARYGDRELGQMLSDPQMIGNKRKLEACINNAKTFQEIVQSKGSFQNYLDSFKPRQSFGNVLELRSALIERFAFLGGITSLHFLMEIGLPVLKPDRVVVRIFHRLGFLPDESTEEQALLHAIEVGQKFVEATGYPIRYVDMVFVAYGQVSDSTGIGQGICLKNNPRCNICGVKAFCRYTNEPRGIPKTA